MSGFERKMRVKREVTIKLSSGFVGSMSGFEGHSRGKNGGKYI